MYYTGRVVFTLEIKYFRVQIDHLVFELPRALTIRKTQSSKKAFLGDSMATAQRLFHTLLAVVMSMIRAVICTQVSLTRYSMVSVVEERLTVTEKATAGLELDCAAKCKALAELCDGYR